MQYAVGGPGPSVALAKEGRQPKGIQNLESGMGNGEWGMGNLE